MQQEVITETGDRRTRRDVELRLVFAFGAWRVKEWRQRSLRYLVVGMALAIPLVAALGLWGIHEWIKEPSLGEALNKDPKAVAAFFGGGMLVVGAVLQTLAASAGLKRREGASAVDGFVLGGWSTIVCGAVLAWMPSLFT